GFDPNTGTVQYKVLTLWVIQCGDEIEVSAYSCSGEKVRFGEVANLIVSVDVRFQEVEERLAAAVSKRPDQLKLLLPSGVLLTSLGPNCTFQDVLGNELSQKDIARI
ncbi:FCPB, partial [Symbiodinium microadriaticum]